MTSHSGWPDGVGLRRYDIIDSTNDEARRLAAASERGPLWIATAEQTNGRGRHDRAWVSRRGNFFATLLMQAAPPHSAELGFVAGLAVIEAAKRYLAPGSAKLKWPNDLLVSGRKAAGILVEQLSADIIAVGIGMNLAHHPDGATSIAAKSGFIPQPGEVLTAVAYEMQCWTKLWRAHGFGRIRAEWIARAGGIGEPMTAITPRNRLQGIFEDLDSDGALVLRDVAGNTHRVTAADVYYGP